MAKKTVKYLLKRIHAADAMLAREKTLRNLIRCYAADLELHWSMLKWARRYSASEVKVCSEEFDKAAFKLMAARSVETYGKVIARSRYCYSAEAEREMRELGFID